VLKTSRGRAALVVSTLALAALGAAGCGSDDSSSTSSTSASTGTAAAAATTSASTTSGSSATIALPQAIKDKGTLTIGTDPSYAPVEFVGEDGSTIEGLDPDLAKALSEKLGIDLKLESAGFDAILPGLTSGKYDLGMSAFTDTKEREKTVDFVTYFSAGTSFFTKASGGTDVKGIEDLCGLSVAVEKGTTQQDDVTAQSKKCTSEGKKAVDLQTFPDQNGANLALQSGRAQIGMADSPVADYQIQKSNGQFKATGAPYGTAPYGIAVPKDSGLAEPLLEALKAIMADGQYKSILDHWGVAEGAITDPVINGAQS
jgi:polar amino acid transport system substrate-binding protein